MINTWTEMELCDEGSDSAPIASLKSNGDVDIGTTDAYGLGYGYFTLEFEKLERLYQLAKEMREWEGDIPV